MAENDSKVVFASPTWVDVARGVLEDLVARHGTEGEQLAVCESFADAPAEIAGPDGSATWHFSIDGKRVTVGTGPLERADITIRATWELTLPNARLVYTPELLAEWAKNPPARPEDPKAGIDGNMADLPPWLIELHNRMAVLTR